MGPLPSKWEGESVWSSSQVGVEECRWVSDRGSFSLSRLVATVAPPPTSTATPAAARKLEVIAPEAPAAEVPVAVVVAGAVGTVDAAWARVQTGTEDPVK